MMSNLVNVFGMYFIGLVPCAAIDSLLLRAAFGRWAGFKGALLWLSGARLAALFLADRIISLPHISTRSWIGMGEQLALPAVLVYPLAVLILQRSTAMPLRGAIGLASVLGTGSTLVGLTLAIAIFLAIFGVPC